ncbi:MAG: glycoside hydrolase family 15 protein [Microbacteriaceae bacterium]
MPLPIEDYAVIGDCRSAALVGLDGSIDWLCLPRFDSPSLFGALLGTPDHGRWLLAPAEASAATSRDYEQDTLVLRTRYRCATGEVEVIDAMPVDAMPVDRRADVIRRVRGISGSVRMRQELRVRPDYANALPWVRQLPAGTGIVAIAGPDGIVVRGPRLEARDHAHVGEFTVDAGQSVDVVLTWFPSHRPTPPPVDTGARLEVTLGWWRRWIAGGGAASGSRYEREVRRSLLFLRALTDADTGGIVAAATTSLPESPGGDRNWDYRYVWLRDASLTLDALIAHGFRAEAVAWRDWLLRAIAGDPADLQIVYGVAGERRLVERELDDLPGYRGSRPVRIGNDAYRQYQGDVFGEVMVALRHAREAGSAESAFSWALQRALMSFVAQNWRRPDNGIWEVRGEPHAFTHSRVMLWAAVDSAVRAVREHGLDGPVAEWERLREELHEEIEEHGFDRERGCYRQAYGSTELDAALLLLPTVGYLEPDDPRMLGTVHAIEEQLLEGGLVRRYRTRTGVDGLSSEEGVFLACSFWLVRQYAASGRVADAEALMDRLCALANDVGMLSEQYDVAAGRQAGNTPQALSHLALVQAARAIAQARG